MRKVGEFYDYGEVVAVNTNSPCMASVYYGTISPQGPRYLLGRSGYLVVNIHIRHNRRSSLHLSPADYLTNPDRAP